MRQTAWHTKIALLGVTLITLICSAILQYAVERQVANDTGKNMEGLARTVAQSLTVWAEREKGLSSQLAADPIVLRYCEELLATVRTPDALIAAPGQDGLRRYLAPHLAAHQFEGFFLIAPDGISLASTRDANTGTPNLLLKQEVILDAVWRGETILSPPQVSDVPLPDADGVLRPGLPTMFTGAPVRDESGDIIGALTFRLKPSRHLSPIFAFSLGQAHGSAFAFDARGRILTDAESQRDGDRVGEASTRTFAGIGAPINDPSNPFSPEASKPEPDQSVAQSGMNLEGYLDSRGVNLFSAWEWLPDLNMGVQVVYEKQAVMRPVWFVRWTAIGVIGVMSILLLIALMRYDRAHASTLDAKSRLETVVSAMLDALITIDEKGTIQSWNRAAVQITGYTEEEAVGQNISMLMPDPWRSEHDGYLTKYIDTGERSIIGMRRRLAIVRKDGQKVPVDLSVSEAVLHQDGHTIFTGVLSDVSAQVRSEDLERARAVAEEANRAKSRFLASMSHEIRTPLNVVTGFTQVLERDETLSERQLSAVTSISQSGTHLLELVNDVLEMAKIESGQLVVESSEFDVTRMLKVLKDMFLMRAESRSLSFDVQAINEFPNAVVGDRQKVRQILINLLGNAFKFTKQGGVVLRAGVEGEQDDALHLRFDVEDTGPGIAPSELPIIFDAFEQTAQGRNDTGGTGLGLAISRELAQAMNGSLTVDSTIGKGSIFTLRVPVRRGSVTFTMDSPDPRTAKVVGLAPGQDDFTVLIVDDAESNRRVLRSFFALLGVTSHEVANGKEAVDACALSAPDIVLMDVAMPVMNGYEATERIRALPNGDGVKILVLSASSFRNEEQVALDHGADGFLRKPYRLNELLEYMSTLTGVQWLHEVPEPTAAAPAPHRDEVSTLAQFETLAPELRGQLAEAARGCYSKSIRTIASDLHDDHPEVAGALEEWVAEYRYDQILAAVASEG